jgi:hypothetical protein
MLRCAMGSRLYRSENVSRVDLIENHVKPQRLMFKLASQTPRKHKPWTRSCDDYMHCGLRVDLKCSTDLGVSEQNKWQGTILLYVHCFILYELYDNRNCKV